MRNVLLMLVATGLALSPLIPFPRLAHETIIAARDGWLKLMGLLGVFWLAWAEPIFCPMAAWLWWHWRGGGTYPIALGWQIVARQLAPMIWWAGIAGAWFAIRAVPRPWLEYVVMAWLGLAVLAVASLCLGRRLSLFTRTYPAPLGQRTLLAGYLALLIPFAPWWLYPVLGLGLWLTGPSWGAVLALGAGLPLLGMPGVVISACVALGAILWLWAPVVYGRKVLEWTPRGDSIDSLRVRLNMLKMVAKHWWREAGDGPEATHRAMLRWQWAYKVSIGPVGHLHCEPVQLCWEYGWAGVATVVIAAWRIGSGLAWGDPWSAAAVIGAVLACASIPLRVAPLGLPILVVWARVAP